MAWRILNIKDGVEESYGNEFDLRGPYEGYKKFHKEWKWIFFICEFSFGIWRALMCPLHGECTFTLLVSQFRESEILTRDGHGRGNS